MRFWDKNGIPFPDIEPQIELPPEIIRKQKRKRYKSYKIIKKIKYTIRKIVTNYKTGGNHNESD